MKLLIISVSAGSGHVQVAKSIEEQATADGIDAKHIDMMDYVSPAMKKAIVDMYDKIASDYPAVWKYMYQFSDSTVRIKALERAFQLARKITDQHFFAFVREYQPTHLICTHPFPAQALESEGILEEIGSDLSLVVTDYGLHAFWLVSGAKRFFVGSELVKKQLLDASVAAKQVIVSGIPVRRAFFSPVDRSALRRKYQVAGRKVVLILSGGQGSSKTDLVAKAFVDVYKGERLLVLAVAGANEDLLASLEVVAANKSNPDVEILPFGWVDAVHELMQIADVVVSKPGGSTVSECVVLKKPIVVFSPIPGQEESNVAFLTQKLLGTVAESAEDCVRQVQRTLMNHPRRRPPMKRSPAQVILQKIAT